MSVSPLKGSSLRSVPLAPVFLARGRVSLLGEADYPLWSDTVLIVMTLGHLWLSASGLLRSE